MYIAIGILAALFLMLGVIIIAHRLRVIYKICSTPFPKKLNQLNQFIKPFGFQYLNQMDIFTSLKNAPQRNFGYMSLFDKTASAFNMVFDCEPIYFNYDNKTWLIELWKGQYGINTGAEIGIYCADKIVMRDLLSLTWFRCASADELLNLSMKLQYKGKTLFNAADRHWWLTGFYMGHFSHPKHLSLYISITFPNEDMLSAFTNALQNLGYPDVRVRSLTVFFIFAKPRTCQVRRVLRIRSGFAQLQNRLFCRLYLSFTRPFLQTIDRMLFIRALIPFSFRKMSSIRSGKKYTKGHSDELYFTD